VAERLYRSKRDRVIAGVAGGLAEIWDVDPSLIRIVWVLLALMTGGLALVVYVVMALVVPERDVDDPTAGYRAAGYTGAPGAGASGWTAPGDSPTGVTDTTAGSGATDPNLTRASAPGPGMAFGGSASPASRPPARDRDRRRDGRGGGLILGLLLILAGGFFLIRQYLPGIDLGLLWPVAAVVAGALLVVLSVRPRRPGA
jgi:phage shock protein C